MSSVRSIAIIGGTGELGTGLARRWARRGYSVVLGSRSPRKAEQIALDIAAATGGRVSGADNLSAARSGDVIVIAVPWASHDAILQEIVSAVSGKIVLDAVVPLAPPQVATVRLPEDGTASQRAQRLLPF